MLLIGIVLVSCAIFEKLFEKTSVPGLLLFIVLGMLFGTDGVFRIPFDNYDTASGICTFALVLIMYYGGMDTNLKAAEPVLGKAALLSGIGTVLTAGLTGLFAAKVLGFGFGESFLLGSVICSTDAASVFSILRSKKMNLKYGTASMLEIESGSNDPFSYMLTVTALTVLGGGKMGLWEIVRMLGLQIVVGLAAGLAAGYLLSGLLPRLKLKKTILTEAVLLGIGFIVYALTAQLAGNGYLAVYLAGILLGNCRMPQKAECLHFFDSLTGVMQMLLFFMLGLLSYPSRLPGVAGAALLCALFLTLIARPAAVAMVLLPFRCCFRQVIFVSFAGMRGAASIAFAILAMSTGLSFDLFHMVFFIVLFSILVQGSLIPLSARRLSMIDDNVDVMMTFNDYTEEMPVQFIKFQMSAEHPWKGRKISEIMLPPGSLLVLLLRGEEKIVPDGETVLEAEDELVMCGMEGGDVHSSGIYEKRLSGFDPWTGKRLSELSIAGSFVLLILRGEHTLIPSGSTVLEAGDQLYLMDRETDV